MQIYGCVCVCVFFGHTTEVAEFFRSFHFAAFFHCPAKRLTAMCTHWNTRVDTKHHANATNTSMNDNKAEGKQTYTLFCVLYIVFQICCAFIDTAATVIMLPQYERQRRENFFFSYHKKNCVSLPTFLSFAFSFYIIFLFTSSSSSSSVSIVFRWINSTLCYICLFA